MKDVLKHFIEQKSITNKSNVVLLYLTYPERTWSDVERIYSRFVELDEKSLVCFERVKEHPYLCFYEQPNNKASMIVDHKLYRRQDYPSCIRLSMYVSCYSVPIVNRLHDLMFEDNTYFYELGSKKIDVDYIEDFTMKLKNKIKEKEH